jgi:O-acetyl-ADP-ribose deacetylase (regulator of RNase III)
MIKEVSGDILLSKAQAIAHGVAPGDHFASGLALSLRERWPAMAKDFRHYSKVDHPKPGTLWAWSGTDGQRLVALLVQEAEFGHGATPGPAHIEYVHHALKELRKFVDTEGLQSLALPKVATTAGRLDWKDVYPLIQQTLGDLKIPVYVYTTYHHGVAAQEG